MTNRLSIIAFMVQVCLLSGAIAQDQNREVDSPNIIFILTDDQRWDAVGYAGNPIIETPNMDSLAQAGLRFSRAFVTTPICAASRASLFTGLYERTHNFNFGQPPVSDAYMRESYPVLLREQGYRTGFVGKFGVKINDGMMDEMFDSSKTEWLPYWKEIDGKKIHMTDLHGDRAIDFIRSSGSQPFCLSLSFWAPHADDGKEKQYFWPESCDDLYVDDEIPVPATADPAFFEASPDYFKDTLSRERWYWRYDTPEKHQEMVKGYYRMITGIDRALGRIQAALEGAGVADNTVIIFMGDNGYFLGERGYAGKWLMYDQSIRVPLFIYDPRQPESTRGRTIDEMALNVDVTPTILQLAGVEVPDRYQGESLVPFYSGTPDEWRTSVFCEHRIDTNPQLLKTDGIRDDTWKFIRYDDNPDLIELYNLKDDSDETRNLAYDAEYAEKVEYYRNECEAMVEKLMADRIDGE